MKTQSEGVKTISKKEPAEALILGVRVLGRSQAEVLNRVEKWVVSGEKRLIFTPNPEMLVLASEADGFKKVLNRADINIPDGIGLVWASRWLVWRGKLKPDQTIASRLAGTDLVEAMIALAMDHGWRVYLLGGRPGVAGAVQEKYGKKIKIEADSGPADVANMNRGENLALIKRINAFGPDLLLVAFGHGKQEKWLVENLARLKIKVGMGVGGAFDFISGRVPRAPIWVARLGLEWLYRLLHEPWRWRRQLKLVKFVWFILFGN